VKGNTINCVKIKPYGTAHWLFTNFKKAHDSIRKDFLHNILIEFGTPMKRIKLEKCVEMKPSLSRGLCGLRRRSAIF
jgi:hypothetical protein